MPRVAGIVFSVVFADVFGISDTTGAVGVADVLDVHQLCGIPRLSAPSCAQLTRFGVGPLESLMFHSLLALLLPTVLSSVLTKASLHEGVSRCLVDNSKPVRSQLNTTIPSSDDDHSIPYSHQLQKM